MTDAARTFDPLDDPTRAADLAAEALRAVNHLTIRVPCDGTPGWEHVGDLYRVLAELRVAVERLPQAIEQLSRHLQRPAGGARYRVDSRTDATLGCLVSTAAGALDTARQAAWQSGRSLAEAQEAVAHLCPTGR